MRREVDAYDRDLRRRLLVKPGITGPWQVGGRCDLAWDRAVRLDLSYVDNWSMSGLADSARGGCITYGLFMFRCICRPGYRHVAAYLLVTGCLRQQVVGDAEKRVHIVGAL